MAGAVIALVAPAADAIAVTAATVVPDVLALRLMAAADPVALVLVPALVLVEL